jgi:hypothetical protein
MSQRGHVATKLTWRWVARCSFDTVAKHALSLRANSDSVSAALIATEAGADGASDHLVRKIDAVLDLSWVHAELAPIYSETGRPSVGWPNGPASGSHGLS